MVMQNRTAGCDMLLTSFIIHGSNPRSSQQLVCLKLSNHKLHVQERWLSTTERVSVSAHFGLPWVCPWVNRGKCYGIWIKKRGFNACQMHRSTYPSIINCFPVIQPVSSKVRHFSTLFAHFGLPSVRPWDNCGKCYMDGKRIQCLSNA